MPQDGRNIQVLEQNPQRIGVQNRMAIRCSSLIVEQIQAPAFTPVRDHL
jgi:hypothetical protein